MSGEKFRDRHTPTLKRAGLLLCALATMRIILRSILAAALQAVLMISSAVPADARTEIQPPFGLVWGLPLQRVEDSVLSAGGQIVERSEGNSGEERWTVEGIAQDGLQRVLFTFTGGRLTGVELQYGKAEWDTRTYEAFMRRVREGLDAEHGPGHLLVRQRTPDPGVLKTLLGYSWSGRNQTVSLIYFSAQDQRNLFRMISLHYFAARQRAYPQTVSRS